MSTSPDKNKPPQNPLGFLNAILTGSIVGFVAVLLAPYVFSQEEPGRTLAQIPAPAISKSASLASAAARKTGAGGKLNGTASPAVKMAESRQCGNRGAPP